MKSTLKTDILERLLIDRAVGELTPDTAALLDEWLRTQPKSSALATEITETLGLAKRVLKPAVGGAISPVVKIRNAIILPFEQPRSRRAWFGTQSRAMAASGVIGLAAGLLLMLPIQPPRDRRPSPVRGPFSSLTDLNSARGTTEFWSMARLRSHWPETRDGQPDIRLLWKSPVRKPEIVHPL